MSEAPTTAAGFYCVADERYFLGAVGLVNSLRLHGHDEPVFMLDCGLTAAQRELLEPHVALVPAPGDAPPTLLKAIAPLSDPVGGMVLLDSDLVVTRPLTEVLEHARAGRVVSFEHHNQRHDPRWGEVLGLGEVPRRTYLDFAMLGVGGSRGTEVLRLLADLQDRIDFPRTMWGSHDMSYSLVYADQDVLNAIVAARVPEDQVVALDSRLAPVPPFEGLSVRDEGALRVAHADGVEPLVVHHYVTKPWLEPTHHGVYSQLLRRLLIGDDVAIRVPADWIPLRFRRGPRALLDRARINARERARFHLRGV
jgi:hypothetical protein